MENSCRKSCRKIVREILAGKSCGKWRRGKSQFKKGSDWWKFSIWNRVMGSQPIRIQFGKILRENLLGKSCGKILWENLAGNSCRKLLWENLLGNSCGKCCRKSCGKILQEILWENLVGKILWEIFVGKCCGKFPLPISKPFLKVIFKICNSSRST